MSRGDVDLSGSVVRLTLTGDTPAHGRLVARQEELLFRARERALQAASDAWVERLRLEGATAHLVLPWCPEPPAFLGYLERELHERFGIDHATVQLEPTGETTPCRLAPEDVV